MCKHFLYKSIPKLKSNLQKQVVIHKLAGLQGKEIAKKLKTSEDSITQAYHRAIRNIQLAWNKEHPEEPIINIVDVSRYD